MPGKPVSPSRAAIRCAVRACIAVAFLVATPILDAQPVLGQETTVAATRLSIKLEPFINLHFLVRQAAIDETPAPALEGIQEAMDAVKALGKSLAGPRGWLQFEGNIARCSSALDARERFQTLPEISPLGGSPGPLREPAVRYAEALLKIEPSYLRDLWPDQERHLREARADLETRLLPHAPACLDLIIASLAMTDPKAEIPVYLVFGAPSPGASTVALRGGGAACFVSVDKVKPAEFLENILHESIHALDIFNPIQDTALNRLRRSLRDAGVPPTDPRSRDYWHTLIFIQAGETIRRVVAPDHQHYGDSAGYYAKVPEVAALERPIWIDYLDKKITLDEALTRIITGIPAPRPPSQR